MGPIGMLVVHRRYQNTESENCRRHFRRGTDNRSHRSGRALINIRHPHMERNGSQFERQCDHNENQTQLHQPAVGDTALTIGQYDGEIQRTGCAVNHRNTVQQQTGGQCAEHKVFQRGFGRTGGIAPQGNHGVERQRKQFQADIGNKEMPCAHHHAHA